MSAADPATDAELRRRQLEQIEHADRCAERTRSKP